MLASKSTPSFTEEEGFLLHSLLIKNRADFYNFFRENYHVHIDIKSHIQKLELEKKLLSFNTGSNNVRTLTPQFTEEEALLLHSLLVKNRDDFYKTAREGYFAPIDVTGYGQKLEVIAEKLLAFAE